jgi:hypothetical protein
MDGWLWFALVLGTFEAMGLVSIGFDYWYDAMRKSQGRCRKTIWLPRDVTPEELVSGVATTKREGEAVTAG